MAGVVRCLKDLRRGLKLDVLGETSREYPALCFLLLSMVSLTVLLSR